MPVLLGMSDEDVLALNYKISDKLVPQAIDLAIGNDEYRPVLEVIGQALDVLRTPEFRAMIAEDVVANLRRIDSRIPDGLMSPKEFMVFAGDSGRHATLRLLKQDSRWISKLELDAFDLATDEFDYQKRVAMQFGKWGVEQSKAFLEAWRVHVPDALGDVFKKVFTDARNALPDLDALTKDQEQREFVVEHIRKGAAETVPEKRAEIFAAAKAALPERLAALQRSEEAAGFTPDEANMPQPTRGLGR